MELLQDMRYGARALAKSPGFATVAILTLALGIAGNATIFTTMKGLLFQMPPVEKSGQIARLWCASSGSDEDRILSSLADFLDWKQQSRSFSGMAATRYASYTATGVLGESAPVEADIVSPGYLAMLRVSPALGRDFTGDDSRPGAEPAVILGHGVWQSQFAGDRSIVGRTILLNKRPYTVVGILPAGFWFPFDDRGKRVLLPMTIDPAQAKRGAHNTMVYARLRDGVSKQQAQAEMDAIAKRIERQYPATNTGWGVRIITLRDEMIKRAGMGLGLVFGPVVFVLLIACANVANMLLARASARQQEIAVRAALGAGRARLLRQLLTESLLLALAAGVLGLLLAWQGTRLMALFAASSQVPLPPGQIDSAVLAFALIMTLATVLLFGLAPALHATRVDLVAALKERESRTGSDRRARRKRETLVVLEVTLAIVFLVVTGMAARMIAHVQSAFSNPGFDMTNLILFDIKAAEGARPAEVAALNRQVLESVRGVPGVQSAGASDGLDALVGGGPVSRPIFVPDRARGSGLSLASASYVTPGLLDTIQIPLRRGRTFANEDSIAEPVVAVINETTARRYWAGDALGKSFKFGVAGPNEPWLTVVGVVADTRTPAGESLPRVYLPAAPADGRTPQLAIRPGVPAKTLIPALQAAIRRIDRNQPVENVQLALATMEARMRQSYFVIGLTGSFAGLAMLLAAAGIYGVMSYNVAERRREIGVRMALGARAGQVLRQLLGRAAGLMVRGLLIGGLPLLAYALVAARQMKLNITTGDVLTVGGAFLLLLGCGLLAAFIPAYRATRVDPMVALRYE